MGIKWKIERYSSGIWNSKSYLKNCNEVLRQKLLSFHSLLLRKYLESRNLPLELLEKRVVTLASSWDSRIQIGYVTRLMLCLLTISWKSEIKYSKDVGIYKLNVFKKMLGKGEFVGQRHKFL